MVTILWPPALVQTQYFDQSSQCGCLIWPPSMRAYMPYPSDLISCTLALRVSASSTRRVNCDFVHFDGGDFVPVKDWIKSVFGPLNIRPMSASHVGSGQVQRLHMRASSTPARPFSNFPRAIATRCRAGRMASS